jgi:predicted HAD superfamily Cof-like phosphohydrolase
MQRHRRRRSFSCATPCKDEGSELVWRWGFCCGKLPPVPNDVVIPGGTGLVRPTRRWVSSVGSSSSTGAQPMGYAQLSLELGDLVDQPAIRRSQPRARNGRFIAAGCGRSGAASPVSPGVAVAAFHLAFDLPRRITPSISEAPAGLIQLRISLLEEEVAEFQEAARQRDLVGVADALADIVYVAYGAAVSFGIDLDAVVAEVHRANMSKLDEHGRPVLRADGKVCKSDRYQPPDVAAVLSAQRPRRR